MSNSEKLARASVPPQQVVSAVPMQQVATVSSAMVSFSPLPPAAEFERFHALNAKYAERILDAADEERAHRHRSETSAMEVQKTAIEIQKSAMEKHYVDAKSTRKMALFGYLCAIVAGVICAYHKQEIAAVGIGASGAVGFVTSMVWRRKPTPQEKR